jgi:hypothetical protein
MGAKYLFFDTELKKWVYGDDLKGIKNPNTLKLDITPNSEIFCFRDPANRNLIVPDSFPGTAANYKKKDGTPYANFEEFFEATKDFFVADVVAGPTAAQITELSLAIGSKADEAATTDTGNFSIVAFFKRLLQKITSIVTNQPLYIDAYFTLTRNANTTVYSDGDAILDKDGITTQKFTVAKSAGRGVCFTNLVAFTTDTGLAGKTVNVVFYKESPANPIADNAAFSYSSNNELIRKGTVSLTFGTGIMAGIAQLGIDVNAGMLNEILCPTGTDVYVQVWLPIGFTPSANSTTIIFKASVIQN